MLPALIHGSLPRAPIECVHLVNHLAHCLVVIIYGPVFISGRRLLEISHGMCPVPGTERGILSPATGEKRPFLRLKLCSQSWEQQVFQTTLWQGKGSFPFRFRQMSPWKRKSFPETPRTGPKQPGVSAGRSGNGGRQQGRGRLLLF